GFDDPGGGLGTPTVPGGLRRSGAVLSFAPRGPWGYPSRRGAAGHPWGHPGRLALELGEPVVQEVHGEAADLLAAVAQHQFVVRCAEATEVGEFDALFIADGLQRGEVLLRHGQ